MSDFAKTIEHIKVLEAAGCTPFSPSIHLPTGNVHVLVKGMLGQVYKVHNPPVCHDSLIAWCGEIDQSFRKQEVMIATRPYTTTDDDGIVYWAWEIEEWKSYGKIIAEGEAPSQLAACLAFIEAVATRLGEE